MYWNRDLFKDSSDWTRIILQDNPNVQVGWHSSNQYQINRVPETIKPEQRPVQSSSQPTVNAKETKPVTHELKQISTWLTNKAGNKNWTIKTSQKQIKICTKQNGIRWCQQCNKPGAIGRTERDLLKVKTNYANKTTRVSSCDLEQVTPTKYPNQKYV